MRQPLAEDIDGEELRKGSIMDRREFLGTITGSSLLGAVTLLPARFSAATGLSTVFHFIPGISAQSRPLASDYFVYVGTYTGPKSKGIYGSRYHVKTQQFAPLEVQAEVVNPSWLGTDSQQRYLYAVSEVGHGAEGGYISSFSINRTTGALTFLNKVPSRGSGPCHLTVDRTGNVLLVANYGSGNIASFAIKEDGSLGESLDFAQDTGSSINPRRQEGPHCHEMVLSPDNRFLFVPDLGLDQIKIYRFNAAKGTFIPNNPPFIAVTPGYGPRHFTFGAGAKFAYLVCEMRSSVMAFSYDSAKGSLTHLQTISNLPADFTGIDNSAEIQADPSGRFLYASNRGNDSITVFGIDRVKGTLTIIQVAPTLGKIPRDFLIDPTGKIVFAANQDSDQINTFSVDQNTGKLTPAERQLNVPSPVCILLVPAA
jgi:6-phosphogluconolactonase